MPITNAGDGRAQQPGGVEHRRVDGDGVGKVLVPLDHLDDKALPGGRVEGVDQPQQDAQQEDLPDADDPASVRAMSAKAWTIARAWVASTVRCRFQRSVRTPASGRTRAAGICDAKSVRPSRNEELLSR